MTTVAERIEDIPVAGEEDFCHIERTRMKAVCGSPMNCPSRTRAPWRGETTCVDCERPFCPECLALAGKGPGVGDG